MRRFWQCDCHKTNVKLYGRNGVKDKTKKGLGFAQFVPTVPIYVDNVLTNATVEVIYIYVKFFLQFYKTFILGHYDIFFLLKQEN